MTNTDMTKSMNDTKNYKYDDETRSKSQQFADLIERGVHLHGFAVEPGQYARWDEDKSVCRVDVNTIAAFVSTSEQNRYEWLRLLVSDHYASQSSMIIDRLRKAGFGKLMDTRVKLFDCDNLPLYYAVIAAFDGTGKSPQEIANEIVRVFEVEA